MSEQQSLALPADPVAKPTHHDLGCGCRVEMDPDGPVWLTAPCFKHADASMQLEDRVCRLLDAELDEQVRELAGRAPTRIERKPGAVGTFAVTRSAP